MLSCATTMMSSFSLQRFSSSSSSRAAVFGSVIILFPQSCARRPFWGRSFFLSFLFSSLSFLKVLVWISWLSFHKRIARRRGSLGLGGCAEKDGFLRSTVACGIALEVLFLLFFLRVKTRLFLIVKCVWYQVVSESAFLSFYLFIPGNNARNVPAIVSDFFKD